MDLGIRGPRNLDIWILENMGMYSPRHMEEFFHSCRISSHYIILTSFGMIFPYYFKDENSNSIELLNEHLHPNSFLRHHLPAVQTIV